MLNQIITTMKNRSSLLKAVKTLIEASSAFHCKQITVRAELRKNKAVESLVVTPLGSFSSFGATEIIRLVIPPLTCYVDYNRETDKCELIIF